jgi:hypothetical protein
MATGRRLSFWTVMRNAMPNFALDAKDDVDMSPRQMDGLVHFQLTRPQKRYLEPSSLYIAGITDNERMAEKVYKACVKHGYILPPPPRTGAAAEAAASAASETPLQSDKPTVNTLIIDRTFVHNLAVISVHAQRRLVSLLFFWEEECNRWRQLDQEEADIEDAIRVLGDASNDDLAIALEAVQLKKRLLPSQRAEGASAVFPPQQDVLPVYA